MFGSLDISTSALVAQRTRLEVITANLANQQAVLNSQGEYDPYRRRVPVFAVGDPATGRQEGVHIREIQLDDAPFEMRYEPSSPYADERGYVAYPNVNSTIETINAMEATRAYEANITATEVTKSMIQSSLRLLA